MSDRPSVAAVVAGAAVVVKGGFFGWRWVGGIVVAMSVWKVVLICVAVSFAPLWISIAVVLLSARGPTALVLAIPFGLVASYEALLGEAPPWACAMLSMTAGWFALRAFKRKRTSK